MKRKTILRISNWLEGRWERANRGDTGGLWLLIPITIIFIYILLHELDKIEEIEDSRPRIHGRRRA